MFCKHCGRQIADDANVCAYCGRSVNEATTSYIYLQPTPEQPKSGGVSVLSIIGFILSITGIIVNILANSEDYVAGGLVILTEVLALILSIVGVATASAKNKSLKGFGIAGIVISALGMIYMLVALIIVLMIVAAIP